MSTRDQAIACITEKLRELAGIEKALHANHVRATKEIGGMSYQTYSDHREAAELHYVTADYYELLIEAIGAIPLFDQLDEQFPREEPAADCDADRPTLAEQLRTVGAEQAALDAEADAFAAERREVEHFDAAEAADVLQIEHDMAVEAGMECDPETCAYCGGA